MTSQINPNNVDGTYPVAGQPNNTQGFRDNFTNIKTNFSYAETEITDLQNKAILKSALSGTTLDNNMADNLIYAVKLQDVSYTYVQNTASAGSIPIDYSAGQYQLISTTGPISLSFANWPVSGTVGTVQIAINVTSTAHTLTLPASVTLGTTGIQGYSGGVITFAATGTYQFSFSSVDYGATVTIYDLNRPLNYFTNTVNVAATTVSTSTSSGALTVAGGVGVIGDLYVGGNIVGNLTVASQTFTGNLAAGNVNTGGQLSAAGNITGGNVITGGRISAGTLSLSGNVLTPLAVTSNITGGNVLTSGVVSATGNVSGNYFIGNGSQLTGITVSAGTALVNGTSNVRVNASGNATVSIGGTSNVAVYATTGEYITGLISATGNITGGNVVTGGGVTAASLAVGGAIYATGTISAVGNITGSNLLTGGLISATGNITSNFFIGNGSQLTGLPASYGNANLAALGSNPISTTGNITGGYILGNGSQLTGISTSTRIVSGTTELAIEAPSGNMQASIGGTANVVVFSPTGINVRGNITTVGTSNCFIGNGSQISNVVAVGVGSAGLVSTTGNVTGGNIVTGGALSAAGNITGGFINATGNVSLTGNVIAGNLTTSTGAMVAVGNITGGNIQTDGQIVLYNSSSIPVGGSNTAGLKFSSVVDGSGLPTFGIFFGSGEPNLAAAQGSLYLRSDGSTTNNRMYVNTDGSTTWTAVTTVA